MENKKLDRFHIKEHIQEAAHDIAAGNIIRSMQVCACVLVQSELTHLSACAAEPAAQQHSMLARCIPTPACCR